MWAVRGPRSTRKTSLRVRHVLAPLVAAVLRTVLAAGAVPLVVLPLARAAHTSTGTSARPVYAMPMGHAMGTLGLAQEGLGGNSAAEINTSIMLMGAATFVMSVFYFVNNEHMKAHAWSVISSTVCVFIAISFYSLVQVAIAYALALQAQLLAAMTGAAVGSVNSEAPPVVPPPVVPKVDTANSPGAMDPKQVDFLHSDKHSFLAFQVDQISSSTSGSTSSSLASSLGAESGLSYAESVALIQSLIGVQLFFFFVTQLTLGHVTGALTVFETAKGRLQGIFSLAFASADERAEKLQERVESVAEEKMRLDFYAQLFGNILMFSAIGLFSTVQSSLPFFTKSVWHSMAVVPVLIVYVGLLLAIMKGVHVYRMAALGGTTGGGSAQVSGVSKQRRAEQKWDENSTNCIIDLGGVGLAFLIVQAIQFGIVGVQPEANGWIAADDANAEVHTGHKYFQPTWGMKDQLGWIVLGLFFIASIALRLLPLVEGRTKDMITPREGGASTTGTPRAVLDVCFAVILQLFKMFAIIICMSFAWALLTLTRWYCSWIDLADIILYKTFVAVVIVLVAFAVISLLNLVYECLDSLSKADQSGQGWTPAASPLESPGSSSESGSRPKRGSAVISGLVRDKARSLARTSAVVSRDLSSAIGLDKSETLEQMIAALGVISGAGFEEAFGSASAVLSENMDLFPGKGPQGQVLTQVSICILIIFVMTPAWKWYIIPTVHQLNAES